MKASPKPRLSVVMAVYNGMPHLKQSVSSILNQTYQNFEFIIVNDASNDGSSKFLKSIKDKRVILLQNKKNLGLAKSLNKGLKHARAEFIARMDADDISHPKRLQTQLGFMEKNPNIDICGTWVEKIDINGKKIGETRYPQKDRLIKALMAWQSPIVHPTFFAREKFFKRLNNYDPTYDYAEDYELLMRAAGERFKMANIPKKLLKWRVWEKRRSRMSWEQMEKVDYQIKRSAYQRGEFTKIYVILLGAKYFITFILPYNLKLRIFKIFKAI